MRKIFAILLMTAAIFANQPSQNRVLDEVKWIVGEAVFEKNAASLAEIYADEKSFLDANSNLDFTKIIPPLASRGLIIFNFSKIWESKMAFGGEIPPMLLIYVINSVLNELEFGEALPTAWSNIGGKVSYELSIQSEFMLSPAALYTELKRYGVVVKRVKKTGQTDFEYELDFSNARLIGEPYKLGVKYKIDIPMRSYLFDLKEAKTLEVQARAGSHWTPWVSFFDEKLNLVSQNRLLDEKNYINLNVPKGVRYALVGDTFSLQNIRRGIEVLIK